MSPVEASDTLRSGVSTAVAELDFIAARSENPIYKRMADLFKKLHVSTKVEVRPREELVARLQRERPTPVPAGLDGLYWSSSDTILVARELVGLAQGNRTVVHEAGHAISLHAVNVVTEEGGGDTRTRELVERLQGLFDEAKAKLPDSGQYWRTDLREFISEVWTNEDLQLQLLNTPADEQVRVPGGTRTLWSQFVEALRSFFGVAAKDGNLLEEVLYASENVAAQSRAFAAQGRGTRRSAPMVSAAADAAPRRPATPQEKFRELLQARVDLIRNSETPNPDNAQTRADAEQIRSESAEMNRSHYYGALHVNGLIDRTADVFPLDNGGYKVILRPLPVNGRTQEQAAATQVHQTFASESEALRFAEASGVRVQKTRAQVKAQPDAVAFVDEYTKATPAIRTLALAVRRAVGLVAPDRADWAGSRMLALLGRAFTDVASRRYFLTKGDNAVQALTGVNPNMAQRFQSVMRQQAAIHRGGTIADTARLITSTLKESGLQFGRLSMYRAAHHTFERNKRTRDQRVALTEGRTFDSDTTGFKFNGLTGDDAARAFLDTITETEEAVFAPLNEAITEMLDQVMAYQLQAGVLSRAAYIAMGGKINGERLTDDPWIHYIPVKHPDSGLIGRRGSIGGGSSQQDIDHTQSLQTLFSEAESFTKAAMTSMFHRELADFYRANPTALDAHVEAEKANVKRGPKGEDITWTDADLYEENSLVFYEDGKRRKIVFNDPDALNYIKARANQASTAAAALGAATHIMAATRTTWSIPFVLQAAVAWDTTMTMLGFEYAANGTLTPRESIRVARMALSEFIPNFRALLANSARRQTNDPYLRLYVQRGGGVAPGARSGFDESGARLRELQNPLAAGGSFAPGLQGAGQRALSAFRKAEDVMHTTEDLARFSSFKAYIKHKAGQQLGRNSVTFSGAELMAWAEANPAILENALEVSRRITGDFSDRGTNHWLSAMFLFFNPAVQGVRQLAGISGTTSGRAGLIFAAVAAGLLAAGWTGEEDDEDLDGESRFFRRRERGRALKIGEGFAWPVPPELRMAIVFAESMVGMGTGKLSVGKAGVHMASSVVDTIAPLNIPEADAPIESFGFNLMPAAAQPFLTAFFGVDSFGNETEIDANMVRDAEGNRVTSAANYERARARDPAWVRQLTQGIYDTTGIDFYPGRVYEVARQLGGSVLGSAQQAGEEGVGAAVTRSFRSRYNEYAIQEEFENTQARFEQRLRAMQRSQNALEVSPERAAAILEMRRVSGLARDLKIAGQSRADIYRGLDTAKREGNSEAAAGWMALLQIYNRVRSALQAEALRRVEELED